MAATAPAWQTEDLLEEWPEDSPSPPDLSKPLPSPQEPPRRTVDVASVSAKRGSLRMLGYASARGLPVRSQSTPERKSSGTADKSKSFSYSHGIPSPPSSRSSSEAEAGEPAIGTCVVKDTEEENGKALPKNPFTPKAGKDIFGALALERMFEPPSPPDPPQSTTPVQQPSDHQRRTSHPYAPTYPSRLSKSVTPPSHSSFATSASVSISNASNLFAQQTDVTQTEDSLLAETIIIEDDTQAPLDNIKERAEELVGLKSGEVETDLSPNARNASSNYPFTFTAPLRSSSADRPKEAFEPSLEPLEDGEPSHSTLHLRKKSVQTPVNPGLRLFRNTYDTYTREHLSALVDSIAMEPSPPGSLPNAQKVREWSPAYTVSDSASGSASTATPSSGSSLSTDARSSKRLRLSPPSPRRRPVPLRDWGAQGRLMMDKIRERDGASGTSASRSISQSQESMTEGQSEGGPTVDYGDIPPTPPLANKPTHRSNPSTTSSTYLHTAQELMARIKSRNVSGSASGFESSPLMGDRRVLSETDDQRITTSSETESKGKEKKAGPSPRRMLRRLSAADQVKKNSEEESDEELAAPQPPFNPEDLNRYVSSSTIATATTVSTSYVKHRGKYQPTTPGGAMRMIRPDEVHGVVPDKIGKMRFDNIGMKWVRRESLGKVDEAGESRLGGSEESADIFEGMESLGSEEDAPETQAEPTIATETTRSPTEIHTRPIPVHTFSAPAILTPTPAASSSLPKPFRSALKNNTTPGPANAFKKKTNWQDETPGASGQKTRSVSFSDGKKNGRMVEVEVAVSSQRISGGGDLFKSAEASWLPSARTKRIQGILEDMQELSLDEEDDNDATATPSKPSKYVAQDDSEVPELPFRSFRERNRTRTGAVGNATFLTECSFGVAHDRLVEIITDVQPFEPHWEELKVIDLKGKGAESVARLKEFLPKLDEVNLNDNAISYLSGIPSTVRTLHVAGNRLSSLTSVDHLRNLQYLDISRNQLDSVSQLECLTHLRELKADGNMVTSLEGIIQMDCLIKLSCRDNQIDSLDLGKVNWSKMESLDLANNKISTLKDVHRLSSLASLTLDGNALREISPSSPMTHVRILRISDNDIKQFDLSLFPQVRTLFADNNGIARLERSEPTSEGRLENLSLRNQKTSSLWVGIEIASKKNEVMTYSCSEVSLQDLQHIKRLYISGNPLSADFFPSSPLYSLTYLEAAACKITSWPANLATKCPNLRILNVNYNYIENLDGLKGMNGLRKLMVVGNRLGGRENRGVVGGLKGLLGLEEIDLRMNPSTLSFYLPILQNPHGGTGEVNSTDREFRRSLPDEWYTKRLAYRGLIMKTCPDITALDGVRIEEGERRKARMLLETAARI
ncbi:protein NUD1, partial [Tremellales sp. Uapishka_1]